MDSSPRPHHYAFAHRILRAVVETQPDVAFRALTGDRAAMMLGDLWKMAAKDLPPEQTLPEDGLRRELHRTSRGETVVVVICPEPQAITETHLIAITATPGGLRYFTLEASVDFTSGEAITVLCEWNEGRHMNFGPGPSPEVPALLDAIEPKLAPLH